MATSSPPKTRSHLPTKLRSLPQHSPRTAETNRLKLSTLFSFASAPSQAQKRPVSAPSPLRRPSETPKNKAKTGKSDETPTKGGLWEWLTPSKWNVGNGSARNGEEEWDEGCFVDALSLKSTADPLVSAEEGIESEGQVRRKGEGKGRSEGAQRCLLLEMPDEM